MSIGHQLLNVPMGDMIREMAVAIADGQIELDANSIEVAQMMGGVKVDEDGDKTDTRVFFGHEYMTVAEANSLRNRLDEDDPQRAAIDAAVSGAGGASEVPVPTRVSMLELGFTPVFYNFVDTIIEVKIAITITRSREFTRTRRETEQERSGSRQRRGLLGLIKGGTTGSESTVSTTQVDASYASKYSYTAEGSSLLRTKLAPVPPPPMLEERIRALMEDEARRRESAIDVDE